MRVVEEWRHTGMFPDILKGKIVTSSETAKNSVSFQVGATRNAQYISHPV
jgi:hypothetical protein